MQQDQTFQVQFKGDAQTYFGIWIVNLLLSMVTLGIYSAWAKVRNKRYFAQNTLIDARRFDYHATGKQIFIGRLIVLVVLILYTLLSAIPLLGIVLFFGFVAAGPYLINRSMAFNARMTSFSGLRFGFKGTFGHAFLVFVLYPFLCLFTLYLAWPFVARAQQRYYVCNHRFGTAQFAFQSGIGAFYKALFMSILWMLVVVVAGFFGLGGFAFVVALSDGSFDTMSEAQQILLALLPTAAIVIAVLPAGFIYRAYIRNAVYAASTLEGGHVFTSTVRPIGLMWVAVSNALAVIFTLGLMLPWARVRMARFLARNTYITVSGSIDDFVGAETEKVGAIGDAFTDFEGIDVDFAL